MMKPQATISRAPRAAPAARAQETAEPIVASASPAPSGVARMWLRHSIVLRYLVGCTALLAAFAYYRSNQPAPQKLTQKTIDAAVLHTLENNALPSQAARAYDVIAPSVVRVRGLAEIEPDQLARTENQIRARGFTERESHRIDPNEDDDGIATGSGVVIKDDGTILTNLHVVAGSKTIRVKFHNNFEAEADFVGARPEHDLAVIKARATPDDLQTATMRSTADLRPGDMVVAVGFPFGIGPSASSGIVSGLKREYRSPQGKRVLSNLIQFDAAANPGNSGGPLVTADGEVVGIVTGILNPTEQRVFIGIGFAVPIENAASAVGMSPF